MSIEQEVRYDAYCVETLKAGGQPLIKDVWGMLDSMILNTISITPEKEYDEPINLNDTVKDGVTGFRGVVIGKREEIGEITKFEVQPRCSGEDFSKLPEAKWFSEDRLEKI